MVENEVDLGQVWVSWGSEPLQGVKVLFAWSHMQVGPVGFVWGIHYGKNDSGKTSFRVQGSYIEPWARRKGVRTAIQKALFDDWAVDYVSTQSGSGDGQGWMEASGYRMDKATGERVCTKRSFQRALSKRREAHR